MFVVVSSSSWVDRIGCAEVPALCIKQCLHTVLIRGKLNGSMDEWISAWAVTRRFAYMLCYTQCVRVEGFVHGVVADSSSPICQF